MTHLLRSIRVHFECSSSMVDNGKITIFSIYQSKKNQIDFLIRIMVKNPILMVYQFYILDYFSEFKNKKKIELFWRVIFTKSNQNFHSLCYEGCRWRDAWVMLATDLRWCRQNYYNVDFFRYVIFNVLNRSPIFVTNIDVAFTK